MSLSALILAAGRGERMRPLTDTTPKPLLAVRGKPLIEWQIEALVHAGVQEVVINTAWLEEQFEPLLGDGSRFGIRLAYSREGRDFGGALETLGGIVRALPLMPETFWVVAGDVFVPAPVFNVRTALRFAASTALAHLWLVPNPPHNPEGDFGIAPDGRALSQAPQRFTYSTIGLYRKSLFGAPWCDILPGNPRGVKAPLAPLLRRAMDNRMVTAQLLNGPWTDVGTPERLAQLNAA